MFRHDLIYDLIAFQLVLLAIALSNTWVLRRARRHAAPAQLPRVSVLVPARNEEDNIGRCVGSLLSQEYPDFEVIVLDDESTDRTRAILQALAQAECRLLVLDGKPLPSGWLGKNWACAQLASQATGDLLFFTDADTHHQPHGLRELAAALEVERADLLTGFPRQNVPTPGEALIVPFLEWVSYCFTPLAPAYRLRLPALSTAVGQALLFRRAAYEAIGGHAAARDAIVEDLELARRIVAGGHRWRLARLTDVVSCRMYRGGRAAVAGLSKNLLAVFGFRLLPYLFAWAWLLVLFLTPWVDLAFRAAGQPLGAPLGVVAACIGLALALWLFVYRQLALPLWPALLYPVTVLLMGGVALRALWLGLRGRLTWKGRGLGRRRVRVF